MSNLIKNTFFPPACAATPVDEAKTLDLLRLMQSVAGDGPLSALPYVLISGPPACGKSRLIQSLFASVQQKAYTLGPFFEHMHLTNAVWEGRRFVVCDEVSELRLLPFLKSDWAGEFAGKASLSRQAGMTGEIHMAKRLLVIFVSTDEFAGGVPQNCLHIRLQMPPKSDVNEVPEAVPELPAKPHSDTPRCDALIHELRHKSGSAETWGTDDVIALVRLAKTLERELAPWARLQEALKRDCPTIWNLTMSLRFADDETASPSLEDASAR